MDRPFFPAPRPKGESGYREPGRDHDPSPSPHADPPPQPKRTIVRRPDYRPTRYTSPRNPPRRRAVLEITGVTEHGWRNW